MTAGFFSDLLGRVEQEGQHLAKACLDFLMHIAQHIEHLSTKERCSVSQMQMKSKIHFKTEIRL